MGDLYSVYHTHKCARPHNFWEVCISVCPSIYLRRCSSYTFMSTAYFCVFMIISLSIPPVTNKSRLMWCLGYIHHTARLETAILKLHQQYDPSDHKSRLINNFCRDVVPIQCSTLNQNTTLRRTHYLNTITI